MYLVFTHVGTTAYTCHTDNYVWDSIKLQTLFLSRFEGWRRGGKKTRSPNRATCWFSQFRSRFGRFDSGGEKQCCRHLVYCVNNNIHNNAIKTDRFPLGFATNYRQVIKCIWHFLLFVAPLFLWLISCAYHRSATKKFDYQTTLHFAIDLTYELTIHVWRCYNMYNNATNLLRLVFLIEQFGLNSEYSVLVDHNENP